ncbi:hypothetical protein EV360DRAFT_66636 [Lentinula raphanica]|nr:hypothetical protein EV360DRAFT_66636 [Lentinula raphanica]
MDSVVLIDVSIGSMAEEPSRLEGKVVIQTVVNEDMLNLANTVHGGCLAYFVDWYVFIYSLPDFLSRSGETIRMIWNDNHKRIMASGTHIKMIPSNPKTKL